MDVDIKNLSYQSMTDHTAGFFGEKREFSSKIGDKIDEKVGLLLEKAYQDAMLIIQNNKDSLIKVIISYKFNTIDFKNARKKRNYS